MLSSDYYKTTHLNYALKFKGLAQKRDECIKNMFISVDNFQHTNQNSNSKKQTCPNTKNILVTETHVAFPALFISYVAF